MAVQHQNLLEKLLARISPDGEYLEISQLTLDDKDIELLVTSPRISYIKTLNLFNNRIGADGARLIASSKYLSNLTSLNLSRNKIGPKGAEFLAASRNLPQLASLNVSHNNIGPRGPRLLATSESLTNLSSLDLSNNHIGPWGIRVLAESRSQSRLTELDLSSNDLLALGAKALAQSKQLNSLTSLSISNNRICDGGARSIANSKNLSRLKSIDLSNNEISEAGAKFLLGKNSHFFNSLEKIDLRSSHLPSPIKIANDLSELRNYFNISSIEKWDQSHVIKTIVIGTPYSGKTTIVNSLTIPDYRFGGEKRTQGFNRKSLPINGIQRTDEEETSDSASFSLDIWDLGGHTLQHMIHSLFFSDNAIYLLVIRDFLEIAALESFIEQIKLTLSKDQKAFLIPILNPQSHHTSSINDCYRLLLPFQDHINISEPVSLITNKDNDRFLNLPSVIDAIKKIVATLPLKRHFQVHREISAIVVNQFKKPAYDYASFIDDLNHNDDIDRSISLFNKRTNLNEAKEELLDSAISYLDHMGTVTVLDPSHSRHRSTAFEHQSGTVIIDPLWVQKGVYALLPPEDIDDINSAKQILYRQLTAKERDPELSGSKNYPGVFRFEDLRPALSEFGINRHQQKRLFEIICHPRLGLVIPLEKERFLVPAYLEDYGTVDDEELAQAVKKSYQTAAACHMIPIKNFPPYFLYRHMVTCCSDTDYLHPIFNTINTSIGRRHYSLAYQEETRISVEIIQHDAWIWCFAHVTDGCSPHSARDVLRKLKKDFLFLLNRRETDDLGRHVPCPSCMSMWSNSAENLTIGTYTHKQLVDSKNDDSLQQCSLHLHWDYSKEILESRISTASRKDELSAIPAGAFNRKIDSKEFLIGLRYFKEVQGSLNLTQAGYAEILNISTKAVRALLKGEIINTTPHFETIKRRYPLQFGDNFVMGIAKKILQSTD